MFKNSLRIIASLWSVTLYLELEHDNIDGLERVIIFNDNEENTERKKIIN